MNNLQDYLDSRIECNSYPILLTVEATNNCNLKCVMCPRELQTNGHGFMDINLFKKIVDESTGLTKFMWLHYMGEPLMNRDIFRMIDYASDNGIKVGISTNGTMLNSKNVENIVASKVHLIIISIDAINSFTYQSVRGEGRYFEQIVEGTKELIRKIGDDKYVSIQFVEQNENKKESQAFIDYWKPYEKENVKILVKQLTDWGGQLDYSALGHHNQTQIPPKSCTEPYRTLVINWNGSVSACCFDYDNKYNLGNVKTQSIKEIWNGEQMKKLRRGLADNTPVGICSSCSGINSKELFEDEFRFYT